MLFIVYQSPRDIMLTYVAINIQTERMKYSVQVSSVFQLIPIISIISYKNSILVLDEFICNFHHNF